MKRQHETAHVSFIQPKHVLIENRCNSAYSLLFKVVGTSNDQNLTVYVLKCLLFTSAVFRYIPDMF